jgi:hypothetical protein
MVRYVEQKLPSALTDDRIVLNMHELAVTSGFAAAYRLGADYPFKDDDDCARLFKLYLGLSHGMRMVRFMKLLRAVLN